MSRSKWVGEPDYTILYSWVSPYVQVQLFCTCTVLCTCSSTYEGGNIGCDPSQGALPPNCRPSVANNKKNITFGREWRTPTLLRSGKQSKAIREAVLHPCVTPRQSHTFTNTEHGAMYVYWRRACLQAPCMSKALCMSTANKSKLISPTLP